MTSVCHIDFESRSRVNLKKTNAYVYFDDPSTDLWVAAYSFGDEEPELWFPGWPCPQRIRDHVESGGLIAAWNAQFERLAWRQLLGPKCGKYNWPVPRLEQYRCVMAQAYARALPGKLEHAALALNVTEIKDMAGHRLMMRMAKPRRSGGWYDSPADIGALAEYCRQDVRTEVAVYNRLPPLSEIEQQTWFLDQRINDRGVYVDAALCEAASKVVKQTMAKLDAEMRQVTDCAVRGVDNVAELIGFVRSQGVDTDSIAKDQLIDLLVRDDLPEPVRRALEIRQEGAKTSTAKIRSMLNRRQADGRMRGTLQYHGASTGRWCLTGESEVLTPEGWVRLDAFEGGDIAQWLPDYSVLFAPAIPQKFLFQGDLLRIQHDLRMDAYMTFDHVLPGYDKRGKFKPTTALALSGASGRQLPLSGVLTRKPRTCTLHTRILVMLQHDGYDGQYAIEWGFAKKRKSTRCQKLLASAGIHFALRYDETYAVWRIRVRRDDAPAWLVKRDLGAWLLQEGHDPRVFIDECQHWDGGGHDKTKSLEVCCKKHVNAEWTVTLAHLAGKCGVVTERVVAGRTYFYANIRDQLGWSKRPQDDCMAPFSGAVYCPATETGFFLCRTNGLIWVSGNSARGAQLQNLPRPSIKGDLTPVIADIMLGNAEAIDMIHGPPMSVVSDCLRGMIAAGPGGEL